MKKLAWVMVAMVLAGTARADVLSAIPLKVTTGTNAAASVSATNTGNRGWIESITVAPGTDGTTGTVTVTAVPASGYTYDAVTTLFTAALTNELTARPRWPRTTTAGAVAGTNEWYRFELNGESLVLTVVDSSLTNMVYDCKIKFEKD